MPERTRYGSRMDVRRHRLSDLPGPGGESHPWMTDSVFEGAPTILEEFER